MLAKRFGGMVIVSRERAQGAVAARANGCDVVVLDDGFQHLRLARDCDVVLVSAEQLVPRTALGAGPAPALLPAGPFRESLAALGRADALIRVHKSGQPRSPEAGQPGRRHHDGPAFVTCPTFDAHFVATALVESVRGEWREHPLSLLAGRRVATVSGIADSTAFHQTVRLWEAEIVEMVTLDDHHSYTVEDWRGIAHRTRGVELVVTTEKDLVKLEHFPFARGKLLALRIAPEVDDAEALTDMVCARAQGAKKGEANGREPGTA